MTSFMALNRLRVMRKGLPVYDEKFHLGVNIIRGKNSCGKSTIADFIFYILGGEFSDWKTAASECDEVQAEISTKGGVITLRRPISDNKLERPFIFFGAMDEAEKKALDGWERFNIRRGEERESFSQIMFRSIGIPEAQSAGASNVTMHQIMRLLYSDQRTPAPRLFRFESFDTREIREAVGDLICGYNPYDFYDNQLKLRDLEISHDKKNRELELLFAALPAEEGLSELNALIREVTTLKAEREKIQNQILQVDALIDQDAIDAFSDDERKESKKVLKTKSQLKELSSRLDELSFELSDLELFIGYLNELKNKLPQAEKAASIIGNVQFKHCPSCLTELKSLIAPEVCVLCGSKTDPAREKSKYLQIKIDLDIQLREASQLEEEKRSEIEKIKLEKSKLTRTYDTQLTDYLTRFQSSVSPRESFLAEKNNRLGQIEREIVYLSRLHDTVLKINKVSEEKAAIRTEIEKLKDLQKALESNGKKRRFEALTLVSNVAKDLLKKDIHRTDEFRDAKSVSLKFGDDAIIVDGAMNFAESSNVILKNTAIHALLSAATTDENFFHPRFVLFDNVEDKGMEEARSHNFQRLILETSKAAKMEHQIIFTTSMITADLNTKDLVVGEEYSPENRTLKLGAQPMTSKTLPNLG